MSIPRCAPHFDKSWRRTVLSPALNTKFIVKTAARSGCRRIREWFAMGKANGVVTGVRECREELVVLADDDVRYDGRGLRRIAELLEEADLVRPQNRFDELPWHARWDTARTLLNRVVTGEFSRTTSLARSSIVASSSSEIGLGWEKSKRSLSGETSEPF